MTDIEGLIEWDEGIIEEELKEIPETPSDIPVNPDELTAITRLIEGTDSDRWCWSRTDECTRDGVSVKHSAHIAMVEEQVALSVSGVEDWISSAERVRKGGARIHIPSVGDKGVVEDTPFRFVKMNHPLYDHIERLWDAVERQLVRQSAKQEAFNRMWSAEETQCQKTLRTL